MNDFVSQLPEKERDLVRLQLERFVGNHATHHRPICLVSSGGTAADLELQAVRSLDNFSTGLRGAIAVEELLKRGYAVVHLWRTGSASPFARVLSQYLGLQQANHGLNVESLGKLFSIRGDDTEDDLVKAVLEQEKDPWLTEQTDVGAPLQQSKSRADISLHRGLLYSSRVYNALKERSEVLKDGRLLTIPFRTVEDYIGKLQLSAENLALTQSLAMIVLAAAVSDFYVPQSERVEHKIQSGSNADGLVLKLSSVPKVMGLLRNEWAPEAFVVSFKLETDKDILREKAERAVEKYGCHMVIGNLLKSRHEKVWILSPNDQKEKKPQSAKEWSFTEIAKPRNVEADFLESAIIDFVVQSHFEFISWHFHVDGSGAKAAAQAQKLLREKKQRVQRAQAIKKAKNIGLEILGTVLAVSISYAINSAIQRRLRS